MATHDRDPSFEPAERKESGGPPGYPSLRVPRRLPWAAIITALSSALIGAAAAWLFLSPSDRPLPSRQELASLPSPAASVPTSSAPEPAAQAQREGPRNTDPRDEARPKGKPSRHTKIVFEPKGGHPGAAPPPPPPSGSASAPSQNENKQERTKGSTEQKAEPFQWPQTRLYHLYRKRDKLHYYTLTETDSQAAQEQNGFKERLSPGYVYTHNAYPKKLIQIQPYALIEPVYIFRVDQGDATFPLYRLYKEGYKQLLTSWTHIRQTWLDKGWQDRGIVGYIYRP